jgi:osmotically-inducible protein OsmY
MRFQTNLNLAILILWALIAGSGCKVATLNSQQTAEDEALTKQVLEKLKEFPLRAPPQDRLSITAKDGIVHLEGVVQDQFVRDKITGLVKSVEGVKDVTENIKLEEGPQGGR